MAKAKKNPPQEQDVQPGKEGKMTPRPDSLPKIRKDEGRMKGKTVLITGGDSGIGRAVAILFAQEGANVAFTYLNEHKDAESTRREVEKRKAGCLVIAGDIAQESFCREVVEQAVRTFGTIDVLINNAAVQYPAEDIRNISADQLLETFSINVFSAFYLVKAALPHMHKGGSIISSTSVTAYRGSHHLIDYAATKGALVAFTRSLSAALVDKGIRVNAVAPGPIWTPLIPATFPKDKVAEFGTDTPMKRAGQPNEVAGCYLFLASEEASYMTGQVLHPNGGEIING